MPPRASDRLGALTEQWFQRAAAGLPGQLPCRKGCSRCCVGLFPITILDADRLTQGLATLQADVRVTITATAQEQMAELETLAPVLRQNAYIDKWPDADQDRLTTALDRLPCPALDDEGRCRVYPFRPVACRTMGIPEEREGLTHGACDVQTFVPIRRLAGRLREEERVIAGEEAAALESRRRHTGQAGEELWLPYGFAWKT
jgi:Fe-S-cluster containining protein